MHPVDRANTKETSGKGLNAWELYGVNQNDSLDTEKKNNKAKLSLNESHGSGFNSKGQTGEFKRMRLESFAKTPSFIKSPGSLVSSAHYTKGSFENYNEE